MTKQNFKPAKPSEFALNTIDEIEGVFRDTGIMLDLGKAVHNEFIAVNVSKEILNNLTAST